MTGRTTASGRRPRGPALWWAGLGVALVCAGVLSFYASGAPDGLEWVAGQLGFAHAAGEHPGASSPLADYQVVGVADPRLAGGLAGVAGTLVVLAAATGLAWALRRRPSERA